MMTTIEIESKDTRKIAKQQRKDKRELLMGLATCLPMILDTLTDNSKRM